MGSEMCIRDRNNNDVSVLVLGSKRCLAKYIPTRKDIEHCECYILFLYFSGRLITLDANIIHGNMTLRYYAGIVMYS